MDRTNGDPQSSGEDGPQASPQPSGQRPGFLERPGRRRKLQLEMARGEKTMRDLAREYGVDIHAITKFRDRHEDTISAMRADIENEFAGLWIAQKAERLSEMIELYADAVSPRDRETKLSVLRHAAEELGQIPNKTTIDMTVAAKVELVGIDTDEL